MSKIVAFETSCTRNKLFYSQNRFFFIVQQQTPPLRYADVGAELHSLHKEHRQSNLESKS
jgi:hypothetical protein